MKCLRIFPEIWARMTCLFESSTRNIAFGRVSRTTPSASNMSCLGMRSLLIEGGRPVCRRRGEDLRPLLGQGHGVLVVGREAAVLGHGRPAVLQDLDLPAAQGDHRLDGQRHAGPELGA